MSQFPITKHLQEALATAERSRRDALGYLYYTFRSELNADDPQGHQFVSRLVDKGWQLQGTPLIIDATPEIPRHLLISMLHAEPRPLEIRGEFEGRGGFRGVADAR
jgi:hypothetical protein